MARISEAQKHGWANILEVNRFTTKKIEGLKEKDEIKNCVNRLLKYLYELIVDRARHGYFDVAVRVDYLIEIIKEGKEELDDKSNEFVINYAIEKVKLIGYPVSKMYLGNMEMWEHLEYLVIRWDVV